MTKKLNLDQFSNYQDQNLHYDFSKNQFTVFMESIAHNLKRMVVLNEIYPPKTT